MKLTKRVMIVPVASLLLLSGCASRVSQFKTFGETGAKYVDTMNKLLGASGEVSIDASSALLINQRSNAIIGDAGKAYEELKESDKLMDNRLQILNDIAEHNQQLKLYFKALAGLAGSNAGTEIATGTKSIVDELSKLNPKISKATLGEAPIGSLVGPATELVVASFQQAALERELKTNAKTIERELALQVAAMQAVATIWKSDQKIIIAGNKKINQEQFLKDNALPRNWAANRKAVLTASTSAELADSASEAARKLKEAFEILVSKGDKEKVENIPLIVNDLNKVLDLIELVKKGPSA
ncbi:MAG: hypothetical protein CDV28_1187 [Candidatus Electronema aureum]|uniref:Lipoprotein n=1 Tax=Candidatus Electronema aureum TaxID=2005002 RepID=A0A521G130_9BACT|nr:MAG: hypothetical protein CDV28_1187 [Candidatus Electronema aureum]